jgi:two-component system, OmpR family, KDP operon response regulator KdpE
LSEGKVLVVDDNPQIRRLLTATLVSHGYEVAEACARDAVEKVSLEQPCVVLLEMNLPGVGGLETCRSLRAGSDVRVIALSARNGEDERRAALEAGADDYVAKPFGMHELLARIRAARK